MSVDISFFPLVSALFILGVIIVILQNLRLPEDFFEKQRMRNELKKQVIKNEIEANELQDKVNTMSNGNHVN